MMNLCPGERNYDPILADFFVNNYMLFANLYVELCAFLLLLLFFVGGAYQFNSSIQRVVRNQNNDTNSAREIHFL